MNKFLLWTLCITLLFTTTGCAITKVDDWVDELWTNRLFGIVNDFINLTIRYLAHTPTEILDSYGAQYVYYMMSRLGLNAVLIIYALLFLRGAFKSLSFDDILLVIVRTLACMLLIRLAPYLFRLTANLTNRFCQTFAQGYFVIPPYSRGSELVAVIMLIGIGTYFGILIVQYAQRVGTLFMVYMFSPIILVMWILPSQANLLERLTRHVSSLLLMQAIHTVELWAFTWILVGTPTDMPVVSKLLVQLGLLHVMVNTPSYLGTICGWDEMTSKNTLQKARRFIKGWKNYFGR